MLIIGIKQNYLSYGEYTCFCKKKISNLNLFFKSNWIIKNKNKFKPCFNCNIYKFINI